MALTHQVVQEAATHSPEGDLAALEALVELRGLHSERSSTLRICLVHLREVDAEGEVQEEDHHFRKSC